MLPWYSIKCVPFNVVAKTKEILINAPITEKINILTGHFKKNKNDKHSTMGLVKAVNRRKRLLTYLKKQNKDSYTKVLSQLNLRK